MAYDTILAKEYSYAAVNLATAFTRTIRGPSGRRGKMSASASLQGSVTTTTTAGAVAAVASTGPTIPASPGVAAPTTPTTLFTFPIPALTAPTSFSANAATPASIIRDVNNFPYEIPADTDVTITVTPNGATGVCDLVFQIDWF